LNPVPTSAAGWIGGQLQAVALAKYGCTYVAHFVADVTVPDDSVFAPGTPFTKTWRIRNDGTCTWGSAGYALHTLTFVGGTQLANSGGVPLPPRVGPGEQVDISIPMVAAIYGGRYISQWKLQLDNGSLIGFGPSGQAPIYVQIVVSGSIPPPTPGGGGVPPSGICSYYTVRPGDYLKLIAARFGTTWEAIAQANRLYNPNLIYAGMRLAIPCSNGTPPPGGESGSYTSTRYHYAVKAPAGWTVKVNTPVPPGAGTSPEFVTFSAPGSSLPQINLDVLTGTPPFTGFENCDRNMIFRGLPACDLSLPAGENPASRLLIFQRGSAYFHIAMIYENARALADWDAFLASFSFTN
jgi:LysM repeat protein